jgi:hypothetical protein
MTASPSPSCVTEAPVIETAAILARQGFAKILPSDKPQSHPRSPGERIPAYHLSGNPIALASRPGHLSGIFNPLLEGE